MEPAIAGEELVGEFMGFQEVDQKRELSGVLRADVGSLSQQVLRVAHTTDLAVVGFVAVAAVDDDRPYHLASGLQQVLATIFQIKHHLRCRDVVGMFFQFEELRQHKVITESCVFH